MKKSGFLSEWIFIFALVITACNSNKPKQAEQQPPATNQPTGDQLVKTGEYLLTIMGCNDCHSPKEAGPQGMSVIKELMLSGYPATRTVMQGDPKVLKQGWVLFVPDLTSASGPWGVSFAANLTPDQSGTGNWTEENFIRALKEGKFKGIPNSRTLLPPMPWQNFTNAKDEDLKAIFAYLRSIPPVSNIVPAAIIAGQQDNPVKK